MAVFARHTLAERRHPGAKALYDEWQMSSFTFRGFGALAIGGAALALLMTACKSLPPSKPASEWTPQEARGAEVYQAKCARCHYPTSTRGLHGPGLQAITKLKSMPSGAPPTDERLSDRILHGYGMMPATPLGDDQLQDLLAYLRTL